MGLSYFDRDSLEVGDFVRIGVRRVATVPSLVYVVLLDFDKILGSIPFSELDKFSGLVKFFRSEKFNELRRCSESQKLSDFLPRDVNPLVAKVVDTKQETIHLTLRGISDEVIANCREKHEENKYVHGILEKVLEKVLDRAPFLQIDISDMYKWIIVPLHKSYRRVPVISMFRDFVNGEGYYVMSCLQNYLTANHYPDITRVLEKVLREMSKIEAGDDDWEQFRSYNEDTERETFSLWDEALSATGTYNQEEHDNCWAGGVAGLANYQLHVDHPTGSPSVASMQHLIDYVGMVYPLHMGNNGPSNFRMANERAALEYVKRFGVCLNEHYASRNKRQMFEDIPKVNTSPKIRISNWVALPEDGISFRDMKRLLVRGPIIGSVLTKDLPSNPADFRGLEKQGIFCGSHPNFSETEKSDLHCVLIIGWTTREDCGPLLHIHNSWGRGWCNGGFAYIADDAVQPLYFAYGAELVQPEDQTPEMLNGGPTESEMLEAVKHLHN